MMMGYGTGCTPWDTRDRTAPPCPFQNRSPPRGRPPGFSGTPRGAGSSPATRPAWPPGLGAGPGGRRCPHAPRRPAPSPVPQASGLPQPHPRGTPPPRARSGPCPSARNARCAAPGSWPGRRPPAARKARASRWRPGRFAKTPPRQCPTDGFAPPGFPGCPRPPRWPGPSGPAGLGPGSKGPKRRSRTDTR
jgi:hypothetical protein